MISESLRGEGALVINSKKEQFIKHKLKELSPRDVLSREIFDEMKPAIHELVKTGLKNGWETAATKFNRKSL